MKHQFITPLILAIVASILFGSKIYAQPLAELLTPDQDICEIEQIQIRIKFTGIAPFDARIEIRNNETNAFIGSVEQVTNFTPAGDGIYTGTYTFPTNNPRINQIRIFIKEARDNSGIWTNNVAGQAIVTSYQMPTPAAMPDVSECGYSVPLTAAPGPYGNIYEWSVLSGPPSGNLNPTTTTSTLFSSITPGAFLLQFKVTNGPCQASRQRNVTLKGAPTGNISTTSKVCETGDATLNVALTGTGPWNITYNNGTSNSNVNGIANPNHSWLHTGVSGETTYKLVYIKDVTTNCDAYSTEMTGEATVVNLKQTVDAGPDNVACGLSYTMQALPGTGNGTWTGPAGTVYSSGISPTTLVTVTNYGLQNFTWTLNNEGCISNNQVNIRFVELPSVSISSSTANICEGNAGQVNLNLTGSSSWTISYLAGTTPASYSFAASPGSISLSPIETTTYQITKITDTYGCFSEPASLSFTIGVDKRPTPNAGPDKEICGTSLSLSAVPSVGNGVWTGSSGSFTNSSSPGSDYSNTYGAYTLRWTETNGECIAWDEMLVSFWEQPQSAFAGDDQSLYLKYVTNLQASEPAVGIGAWSIEDGFGNIASVNNPFSEISG